MLDVDTSFELRLDHKGRHYYFDVSNKTSGYLPMLESEFMINNLPPGYELRHDLQGRQFYVNHNDQTTSYMNPNRLEELRKGPFSRHDTCVIQKTIEGSEFVVDYAPKDIYGPDHDRRSYYAPSFQQDGKEYLLRIQEGKVLSFFPKDLLKDGNAVTKT